MIATEYRDSPRRRYVRSTKHAERAPIDPFDDIKILLLSPDGLRFDITNRVVADIGSITEATEQQLTEMTHGDVELTLADQDGAVERFFSGIDPDDVFEVWIDRKGPTRRPRRTRLFGGVLDLPWSLRFNRQELTAHVQVFSFSKLLERASAEEVKRSFGTLAGTVTASTNTVTLTTGDTSLLERGDLVQLDGGGLSEEQEVATVTSSTVFTTKSNWSNGFTAAALTVNTPYHRFRSPQFLAEALFTEAGIVSREINIAHPQSLFPIATPVSREDIVIDSTTGKPKNALNWSIVNGKLYFESAPPGPSFLQTLDSMDAAWTATASPGVTPVDWTPYQDAEPSVVAQGEVPYMDSVLSARTWDPSSGDYWQLRDGVFLQRDTGTGYSDVGQMVIGNAEGYIDWCPSSGEVWCSALDSTASGINDTKAWDGATFQVVESALAGQLRYLRRLDVIVLHERLTGSSGAGAFTTNLHIYDPATRIKRRTITVPAALNAHSMRVFDDFIAAMYSQSGTTRVRVWDHDWNQRADYEINADSESGIYSDSTVKSTFDQYATVFTDPESGDEYYVTHANGEILVLSTKFAGVVPYADFEGMSCSAALRELALITMAYVNVDHYKRGSLLARDVVDSVAIQAPVEIGTPLSQETRAVWEFFANSAIVEGKFENGDDLIVIAGQTGDSARRVELESQLITTVSLAEGIGNLYVSLFNRSIAEEEVSVEGIEMPLHVFGYVRLQGRLYLVIQLSLAVEDRVHELRLVEA